MTEDPWSMGLGTTMQNAGINVSRRSTRVNSSSTYSVDMIVSQGGDVRARCNLKHSLQGGKSAVLGMIARRIQWLFFFYLRNGI